MKFASGQKKWFNQPYGFFAVMANSDVCHHPNWSGAFFVKINAVFFYIKLWLPLTAKRSGLKNLGLFYFEQIFNCKFHLLLSPAKDIIGMLAVSMIQAS